MASAVSGSTDVGAFGLARGVLAGVAGSGGANRRMILDIRPVANTRITRNTNTKPMPAIISSTACDIRSFIANSYHYKDGIFADRRKPTHNSCRLTGIHFNKMSLFRLVKQLNT